MNCALENSSLLGNDYPEDGGRKLHKHTDSSTWYHAPEDLNTHDHNYGNLKSGKLQATYFFF